MLNCPLNCGLEGESISTIQTHLISFHGANTSQINIKEKVIQWIYATINSIMIVLFYWNQNILFLLQILTERTSSTLSKKVHCCYTTITNEKDFFLLKFVIEVWYLFHENNIIILLLIVWIIGWCRLSKHLSYNINWLAQFIASTSTISIS